MRTCVECVLAGLYAVVFMAFLAALAGTQEPDWSGQYESRTYTLNVSKTATGYNCEWIDTQGVLTWYGVIARDDVGRWIETYPPDLSPRSSEAWEWEADEKGNPLRVVRGVAVWELKKQ